MMPIFQTFPKAVNGANGKVVSAVKELQPPYEPADGLCYKTLWLPLKRLYVQYEA